MAPCKYHHRVIVRIPAADFDVMAHLGSLVEISPVEDRYVFLSAMCAALDAGAGKADLDKWAGFASTVEMKFEVIPDRFEGVMKAVKTRDGDVARAHLTGRTTYGSSSR